MPNPASAAVAPDFQWYLREAQAGSREARGKLWLMSQTWLCRVANMHMTGDLQRKDDPFDLVQETFLHAEMHFAKFQGECLAELHGWLKALLLRRIDNLRHYYHRAMREVGREQALSGETASAALTDQPLPPSVAIRAEELEALHRCLERLPERWRQVIELHMSEECSWEEVGVRLDCSAGAAEKIFQRAIRRLRELLEKTGKGMPAFAKAGMKRARVKYRSQNQLRSFSSGFGFFKAGVFRAFVTRVQLPQGLLVGP